VICVETIGKIRRWHRVDKLSISEIARRLGASRNTVAKYLEGDVTRPKYKTRPKRSPVMGAWAGMLEAMLLEDAQRPRKERRTAQRLHDAQGQEFVIGGYTPSASSFDALIFGYYEGDRLMYVAKTRNGFTPRSRLDLYRRLRKLEIEVCPFANLPEAKAGRWRAGLNNRQDG
jgi:transcriptional regulator with XRE-family HTH domain